MMNVARIVAAWVARRWRGLAIVTGIHAVVLVVVIGTGAMLSRSPSFCANCHYEEPFVEEWKKSKHGEHEVPCWKCHIQAGLGNEVDRQLRNARIAVAYLFGSYSLAPRVEIPDAACTQEGCHGGDNRPGRVRFTSGIPKKMGEIWFDHDSHLDESPRGVRMPCVSCHSRIVQAVEGEHMTVTKDSCFLCHFKDLPKGVAISGCRCHGTPEVPVDHKGFKVEHEKFAGLGMKCADCHLDVSAGDGQVPQGRCRQCHMRRDAEKMDLATMHETHVTGHDITCDRCHERIEHRQVTMVRTLEVGCAACHKETHDLNRQMYMGIGVRGVESYPDVMFRAGVGCDGCHLAKRDKPGMPGEYVKVGTAAACTECHGDERYGRMTKEWKELLGGALRRLAKKRAKVVECLGTGQDPAASDAREALARADFNMEFLRRAHGEHNILYAERILVAIQTDLDAAARASANGKTVAEDALCFDTAPITANCTAACHTNMDRILSVKYQGLDLSHRDHVVKHDLKCGYCHDNTTRHGAVRLSRERCVHCHHTQQAAECGKACHERQTEFVRGVGSSEVAASPDPMAGQVQCAECHVGLTGGHDRARVRQACVDCHDDKYRSMADSWQAEVSGRVEKLKTALTAAEATRGAGLSSIVKARGALGLIEEDRSRGAHNPGFARKLIEAAEGQLSQTRP